MTWAAKAVYQVGPSVGFVAAPFFGGGMSTAAAEAVSIVQTRRIALDEAGGGRRKP